MPLLGRVRERLGRLSWAEVEAAGMGGLAVVVWPSAAASGWGGGRLGRLSRGHRYGVLLVLGLVEGVEVVPYAADGLGARAGY